MVLVSPAVPSSRVLQGTLVLLVLLVLGSVVSVKLFMALWPARWTILATVLLAEWCFYIFWYRRTYEDFNRVPEPCAPEGFTEAEGQRMWQRFIVVTRSLPGGVDPEPYLAQWFCNAPFDTIKRGNVEEMLTYGFFYRRKGGLSREMQDFPKRMVRELEAALKVTFPEGYTPGMRFMSHLWEDLRANYRPLLLYVGMEVLHLGQRLIMAGYGFHHRQMGLLGYYTLNCGLDATAYHQHSKGSNPDSSSTDGSSSSSSITGGSSSKLDRLFDSLLAYLGPDPPVTTNSDSTAAAAAAAATPIDWTPFADPSPFEDPAAAAAVPDGSTAAAAAAAAAANPLEDAVPKDHKSTPVMFLHGVGGLWLYLDMLKHVIALGHPVIVVEYKHVAMRLSSYIPSVDELTQNVVRILDFERINKVCVVGHSYGSFMASRLNMRFSSRLHSLCVIDPVALGMFMPHLLHNFMYRRPRVDWKRPDILLRDLVLWFASRDVHIAATFARRFYWTEINMWPEDLPAGSCVVLSGNDDLCHAEEVKKMCEVPGHIRVIVNPNLFHGAILLSRDHTANLMREVQNLLATSGSLVVHMARPVLAQTISAARSLLHEVETLKSSPSPYPSSKLNSLEGRQSSWQSSGGLWGRVSSFKGTLSSRTSMPTPSPTCVSPLDANGSSRAGAAAPERSPSAPPTSHTAAPAATAATAATAAAAAAATTAATAAAAATQQQQSEAKLPPTGSSNSSSSSIDGGSVRAVSPAAPAGAGWWGPAAAAAAAECEQQPPVAAMSQHPRMQQRRQLSTIMSVPEASMSGAMTMEGVAEEWDATDQNPAVASGALNPSLLRGASNPGFTRAGPQLGHIQEDVLEQQQQQQQQGNAVKRSTPKDQAAAGAAAAAAAGAKGSSVVSSRGADAAAVGDQAPAGPQELKKQQ